MCDFQDQSLSRKEGVPHAPTSQLLQKDLVPRSSSWQARRTGSQKIDLPAPHEWTQQNTENTAESRN